MTMKEDFIRYFGQFQNEHFIQVTNEIDGLFFKRNTKEETLILIDRSNDKVFYNNLNDFNDDMTYIHHSADKLLNGYFGNKKQKKEHNDLMNSISKIENICRIIKLNTDINNDLKDIKCANKSNIIKF